MASTGSPALYLVLSLIVLILLAVDFLVLRAKGSHRVPMREAALWSLVWVGAAGAFCGWFWWKLTWVLRRCLLCAAFLPSRSFQSSMRGWVS